MEGAGDDRLVQVVYSADPNMPLETRSGAGRYTFEQSHSHLHIDAFAYYELWSVDEEGDLQEPLVSNPKVGFCLIDAEIVNPKATSRETQVYWGCRSEVQGLSPGLGGRVHSVTGCARPERQRPSRRDVTPWSTRSTTSRHFWRAILGTTELGSTCVSRRVGCGSSETKLRLMSLEASVILFELDLTLGSGHGLKFA